MSDRYIKMFKDVSEVLEKGGYEVGNMPSTIDIELFINEIINYIGLKFPPGTKAFNTGKTRYKSSEIKEKIMELTGEDKINEKVIEDQINNLKKKKPKTYKRYFDKEDGKIEETIKNILKALEEDDVYQGGNPYRLVSYIGKDKFKGFNEKTEIYFRNKDYDNDIWLCLTMSKDGWSTRIELSDDCENSIKIDIFNKYRDMHPKLREHYKDHEYDAGSVSLVEKDGDGLIGRILETKENKNITNDDELVKFVSEALNNLKEEYEEMADEIKLEKYKDKLEKSKNIIFRGAPGTGKTYLARNLAAYIVSNASVKEYDKLKGDQVNQIGFVQFHPSYDYTDFVEGLRPIKKEEKPVVEPEPTEKEDKSESSYEIGFELKDGVFKKFCDEARKVEDKNEKYIFIIDEINRGEISKIFGELFFSIDPGYRGDKGGVLTQYANLHDDKNEKFYIPNNVYIIGTMNDIDRSVDTFDFAMRRRFRFIEIKPEDTQSSILSDLNNSKIVSEIKSKMDDINLLIRENPDLGHNYQLGAAYFAKLKDLNYNYKELREDFLDPLLSDYLQGTDNAEDVKNEMLDIIYSTKKKAKKAKKAETGNDELSESAEDDQYEDDTEE